MQKNNCLIQLTSLVIICLLLLAVASIGCYCYYARDWIIKYNTHNHINNLKEISSKNRRCCYFGGIIRIEDFNFDSILLDEKSHGSIFIYDISYKTLIGAKPYLLLEKILTFHNAIIFIITIKINIK